MARVAVVLNINTSSGAQVAAWQDAGAQIHQMVLMETQNGSADPVAIGSGNPMPVQASAANPVVVAGTVASGVADVGNGIKVSGIFNSSPPTFTNGQRGDLQVDASGFLKVNISAGAAAGGTSSSFSAAMPASGTAVGASDGTLMKPLLIDGSGNLKVNIAAGGVAAQTDNTGFTAGTTTGLAILGVFNDSISALGSGNAGVPRLTANRQLLVAPQANVNGGWTPFRQISAASTNAANVKASAGCLGAINAGNNGASAAYLKLYNKATAPTVGTDTPVHTIFLPAGGGNSYPVPAGLMFTTGIAMAVTGLPADSDTTAVALNQVVTNLAFN
jgi:hypothetical protein